MEPRVGALWFHPLANLFPLIEGAEFEALVADVREHGLRERIVIYEGMILDGRNRYCAAIAAGLISSWMGLGDLPRPSAKNLKAFGWRQFDLRTDGDPLTWVLSKNLHRRHLTDGQRTAIAADLVVLRQGQRTDLSPSGEKSAASGLSKSEAADALHVSERSIERQLGVKRDGAPALVDAVRQGRVTVATAEEVAKLPVSQQLEILRGADPRAFSRVAKEKRAERQDEKKERRASREAELGACQVALPEKRYGVILADPEWRFAVWSEAGMDRAADNHYPTSDVDVLKAREVASIAAEDCVLLLWATVPMLQQGLDVMAAWGFAYKSHFVWLKDQIGTGYWNRNQHELLLLGTRGDVPAPAMGTQFRSALAHPVGAHSEKPPFAHEIAETYFPSLPKIELNARTRRDGWDSWGLEVPEDDFDGRSSRVAARDSADQDSSPGDLREDGVGAPDAAVGERSSHEAVRDSLPVPAGEGTQASPATHEIADAPGEPAMAEAVCTHAPPPHPDLSEQDSSGRPALKTRADSPMSREACRPILIARYADEPTEVLSAETGVPVNTLRSWAYRWGLTSKARISASGKAWAERQNHDGEPRAVSRDGRPQETPEATP